MTPEERNGMMLVLASLREFLNDARWMHLKPKDDIEKILVDLDIAMAIFSDSDTLKKAIQKTKGNP